VGASVAVAGMIIIMLGPRHAWGSAPARWSGQTPLDIAERAGRYRSLAGAERCQPARQPRIL